MPSSMDDYIQSRVLQRLRSFVREHFECDVLFADAEGRVHGYEPGERFWTSNPVCTRLTQTAEGLRACTRHCKSVAMQIRQSSPASREPVEVRCHAGFDRLFIPIVDGEDFVGFIKIGSLRRQPFSPEEIEALRGLAEEVGEDPDDIARDARDVPLYSDNSIQQLRHLLKILVDEIVAIRRQVRAKERKIGNLEDALRNRYRFTELVGNSEPMQKLFELLSKVSQADSPVLIQGENGTGKELVAKAIHFNSPRRRGPFIVQNCAAFNDNLLESELFGHVRGAFTGANQVKKGLFEAAHGGTFFLDEIGEMSPALQSKLLRVLQDGTFTPVGSTTPQRVDVRVLAATNRDLAQMVDEGSFRQDLFYRINVVQVNLPALRERADDVPLLAEHFLRQHAQARHEPVPRIAPAALKVLQRYRWPGNVRELENEVERMLVLAAGREELGVDLVSERIRARTEAPHISHPVSLARMVRAVASDANDYASGRDLWAAQFDEVYFTDLLRRHQGNIAAAARNAGVHRMAIYRWLRKRGLDAKDVVDA